MVEAHKFDVFLCHNSQDKSEVIEIARQLKQRGLNPWLDVWELPPGRSWQELLEEQIEQIQSAAVFVGSSGLGPWQQREMRAFLSEFVNRGCPVIPVLLESAPKKPVLPIFLRAMTWVDFKSTYYPDPMEQLIWGITGENQQNRQNQEQPVPNLPSGGGILSTKAAQRNALLGGTIVLSLATIFSIFLLNSQTPSPEPGDTSSTTSPQDRSLPVQPNSQTPSPEPGDTSSTTSPQDRSLPVQPTKSTLISKVTGVDYTPLRDLLAAGEWKEADQETATVMARAVGRESQGGLDEEDMDNFPCEDLRIINQLWLRYSGDKFGFSVQKEIYESLGGTREYNEEVWNKFGDRVGWRKEEQWLSYSDLTFDLEADQAHLPYTDTLINNWLDETSVPQNSGISSRNWVLGSSPSDGQADIKVIARTKTCNL